MPKLRNRLPKLRLHKASGRAVVTLNGQDHYLGAFGSPEAQHAYDRAISEWLARGRRRPDERAAVVLVKHVAGAFERHAEQVHRRPDGQPGTRLTHIKPTMRILRQLYGQLPAGDFGPKRLKAFREHLVERGLVRGTVNDHTRIVVQAFRHAVGEELIPPAIWEALRSVEGLRKGRTSAPDNPPVTAVAPAHVRQVLPRLSPTVAAMVEIQMLTGMRPGELVIMRGADLDTTGRVWIYRPAAHKNSHRGHDRAVAIGPRAQALIRPFLRPDLSAYLFSPAEAERERRELLHAQRVTPATVGNRPGTNRRELPMKRPGRHYTPGSYRRAVHNACDAAFPPPPGLPPEEIQAWTRAHRFSPARLRHTAATEIRKGFGLDAAQVVLGHQHAKTTEIYAEKNLAVAVRVMEQIG